MKKIYKNFIFSALSLIALSFISCNNNDDLTGQSTLEVSPDVKISVTTDFASPVTIVEGDNKYKITISLDKIQSVDVVVKINQIGGTASTDDYSIAHEVRIPAYKLSASTELIISKDELKEELETLKLQVSDITTGNATITPVIVSFNIQNYTEGSLITDLSWSTAIKDVTGTAISPTAAADFKLLITKLDYNSSPAVATIDASKTAFESFEMLDTQADGDYLVVAEAVSYKDLGSQGFFDLDLSVTFNQVGTVNDKTFTFANLVKTETKGACGFSGFYKLAQIKKSGSNYTITQIGQAVKYPVTANTFNGDYVVTADAWADYSVGDIVPVEYNAADGTSTFRINNVNHPYLVNAATSYLLVTINPDATVTVVANEDYDYGGGDVTSVTGTGTVGFCGSSINLSLKFPAFTTKAYKFTLVKK
jgi:hypothetical protein